MITFKPLEEEDLTLLQHWRNSPGVLPYVREYRFLSDYDQDKWWESYQKSRRTSEWDQELMIIQLDTGKDWKTNGLSGIGGSVTFNIDGKTYKGPIGVGGFVRTQWRNRKAELSFFICKDSYKTREIIKDS